MSDQITTATFLSPKSSIVPTVGRVVYAFDNARWPGDKRPALVIRAWGDQPDSLVNAKVEFDPFNDFDRSGVPLAQQVPWNQQHSSVHVFDPMTTEQRASLGPTAVWCEWMPFQVGQVPTSAELVRRIGALEEKLEIHSQLWRQHEESIQSLGQTMTSGLLEAANQKAALPAARLDALDASLKEIQDRFANAAEYQSSVNSTVETLRVNFDSLHREVGSVRQPSASDAPPGSRLDDLEGRLNALDLRTAISNVDQPATPEARVLAIETHLQTLSPNFQPGVG